MLYVYVDLATENHPKSFGLSDFISAEENNG